MRLRRENIYLKIYIMLLVFLLTGFSSGYAMQEQTQDSLIVADSVVISDLELAIERHDDMIARYPDELFVPNLMFELAELHVEKSENAFKKRMAEYEDELKRFEANEIAIEPIFPRISYKETIELCYKLLEKFPQFEHRDQVIYRLATAHLEEGNQEKAKEYFQKLIFEAPHSSKLSEAQFRLGEYYFNNQDYYMAIDHYKQIIDNWDDPFFNMALYKLGWSYFNINDYSNSITTYLYLISDIKLMEELPTSLLAKTKADVKNEAIDYIAHSFCEYGGAEKAKAILSEKGNQEHAALVLERMGEIYKERNYYPEAVACYEAILDMFPYYEYAPNIHKQIIECHENDDDDERALIAKEKFVEKYGPGSDWISHFPDGQIRNDALIMVQEMQFSLGTYYQSVAQEKNRKQEYDLSIQNYEDYLEKFNESEKKETVNYYLAECYFEVGDYERAANAYYNVMTSENEVEFKSAAAYNRILSFDELMKKTNSVDSLTFYLENFLGEEATYPIPIRVASEPQANLIKACNDFVKHLPQDPKMTEVLMKYGEVLYGLNHFDLAIKVYKRVAIPENRDSDFYGSAMNMIAQSYFKLNDLNEAEKWYIKVADVYPDSTEYLTRARKMLASAQYKKAENMNSDGRPTKAAAEFLKLAFSTTDPEIAKASIVQAASLFEQDNDLERAVRAYERMIEEQPDIGFLDELLIKAALLREEMQNWIKATDHYTILITRRPQSTFAPVAMYNMALCYENMNLWYKANQTYEQYVNRFPDYDADKTLLAHCRRGENLKDRMNNAEDALKEFENTLDAYARFQRKGLAPDEYIPAKAQYLIAEINFDEYKKIRIVPPLKLSLQKKQESLSRVLKAYIATGKYKVADWTTASLHRAGMSFEELCDAVLLSPAPSELSSGEVEIYYENLHQQLVVPFKEKALEFYKSNVANAKKNNIENEWTRESEKRIGVIMAELGQAELRDLKPSSTHHRPYSNQSTGGGS
ncbi:tetratricopeptide repeat protein [candidate division KSB1 bacterium]|nr:tetratricopeptide repeat protein [candidate division KSB1 bacterium]